MFGRRQRHARGHRIPVRIVADASVLPQERDTTIVVDDFGLDEALLPEVGCRCCTVRAKLQAALRKRLAKREQRPFSRVSIVSRQDAAPILRTFTTAHALGGEFYAEHAPSLPDGANNFTLTERAPVSWGTFSRFMATLMALRGADLLQVRGFLSVEGCRGPVAVQCMQHLSLPPVELQVWPDSERTSRVEFVTRGIDEKMVRDLFDAVRAIA